MRQEIITISDNGMVFVPDNVQMRDFEIAELFGVMIPTVRSNILAVLKSGVCDGDFSNGGIVIGKSIIPDYYGLDMVVALAFRIQSYRAGIFRKWVLGRVTRKEKSVSHQIFVSTNNQINKVLN